MFSSSFENAFFTLKNLQFYILCLYFIIRIWFEYWRIFIETPSWSFLDLLCFYIGYINLKIKLYLFYDVLCTKIGENNNRFENKLIGVWKDMKWQEIRLWDLKIKIIYVSNENDKTIIFWKFWIIKNKKIIIWKWKERSSKIFTGQLQMMVVRNCHLITWVSQKCNLQIELESYAEKVNVISQDGATWSEYVTEILKILKYLESNWNLKIFKIKFSEPNWIKKSSKSNRTNIRFSLIQRF